MKIFLDEKKLDNGYKSLSLPELLNSIQDNLDDKILKTILVNDVEVNERYLKETLIEKEDIKSIKFVTKKTEILVKETLDQIDEYLPTLKKGVINTADLFRKNEIRKANSKYQQIIEGIVWYTGVISKIVSLLAKKDIDNKVEEMLNELNKTLTEMMVAHKKDDIVLVADMLEYEIVDYIDDFIELTGEIKVAIRNEKSEK